MVQGVGGSQRVLGKKGVLESLEKECKEFAGTENEKTMWEPMRQFWRKDTEVRNSGLINEMTNGPIALEDKGEVANIIQSLPLTEVVATVIAAGKRPEETGTVSNGAESWHSKYLSKSILFS